MSTEITVTFANGKRRKLKTPDMLWAIDGRRKAYFVMNNLQVFTGYTDGVVDEDGDFWIKLEPGALTGIGLPHGRLMGWAYVNTKRAKK